MPNPIIALALMIIDIYMLILIIWIIVSWLIHFQVINTYNPFVSRVNYILHKLTDPVLSKIRKFVPPVGGLDISPLILWLILWFVEYTILWGF